MQPRTSQDYATVDQLEQVWRELSPQEEARAGALIHQASVYLRQIAKNNGIDLDAKIVNDDNYADMVSMIVLNSVQRTMAAPIDMPSEASQYSQSASPYSESMSFSAGTSTSLYFKNQELKSVGITSVSGKSEIGLIRGVR